MRAGSIFTCPTAPVAVAASDVRSPLLPHSPRALCTGSPTRSCPRGTIPLRIATMVPMNLLEGRGTVRGRVAVLGVGMGGALTGLTARV